RRISEQSLADTCCQAKTKVGVDVDLADCRTGCFTKLVFRNADGILKSAAVCVDDLNVFLRNRRCAVKYDRESRNSLLDLMQDIEAKLRFCTRFELECAVACTDRDCKRVNAGSGNEFLNLIRLCIGRIFSRYLYIIFDTGQSSKLGLNYYAVSMSIFNNFLCHFNVLFKREMRTVDHDRCKAA